ncbi:unnamed protein product, partial [Thlaspi arvense]
MASSLAISFNSSKWNPQSLSSVFFPTIHPNKTLSFPLHPFKPNSLNIYCSPSLPTSSYLIPDLDKTQEKEEDESDERPLHQTWRQIQGCHDWQGLLDPTIHPNLRREIIRYGEFAQSCYDSFDFDPHSKYCGTCNISFSFSFYGKGAKIPITVFSFSGPRVGNLKFKERCDKLGVKVLRVINVHDKVPTVPGILANEKFWCQKYLEEAMSFPWSYAHVGVELALDHTHSPFLKDTKDIICSHNLEAHLHLLDGYNGRGSTFESVTQRDIALVNKSSNFLREEFGCLPTGGRRRTRGWFFRERDGRWVVPERAVVEAPPPDTAHHFQEVMLQLAQSSLKAL